MKKLSLVVLGTVVLAGCATHRPILGTVTPLKEGYIAEASVNNGNVDLAKQIALNTAAYQCGKYDKEFYVINEESNADNGFEMDDNTADMTNLASRVLLGSNAIKKTRTVKLKFDCKQ